MLSVYSSKTTREVIDQVTSLSVFEQEKSDLFVCFFFFRPTSGSLRGMQARSTKPTNGVGSRARLKTPVED